jgi:gamma-F420-2:alpha-L-glutamate ligase
MKGWILYSKTEEEITPDYYEISQFKEVAENNGIDISILKPQQFDLVVTRDDRKSILVDDSTVTLPDFFLPRMGASTTYFALAVIRHLERLGVNSFNKSDSIEMVKDKLYTQQVLAASNLPFAKTMLVKFPINASHVEKHLGFPVVVKTVYGSQGAGVFLAENKSQFEDLMNLIAAAKSNANIILQEFVASKSGQDLRVITVGGRAVCCMKRSAQDGTFKANFSAGATVEPYELTQEIEWIATEASRICNLDIAGVDLLFDGDHYKICEINSSPGFRGMEQCHDISIAQKIFDFIRVRLGLYGDN